jgi:ribonuclease T1
VTPAAPTAVKRALYWLPVALVLLAVLPAWSWQLPQPFSAPGTVALAELPPEAASTLQLIKRGGPFPYRKDGSVFQNRERRLPQRTSGYYREYTVPTPNSRDRGARRIVAGQGKTGDVRTSGEYYFTADHYRTFRRIHE